MSLKRILKTALFLGVMISSVATVKVFADPTFKVGTPIDISTNKPVNELTPGQAIEVPIDLEGVNSLYGTQLQMHYDDSVLEAGVSRTDSKGRTYNQQHNGYTAMAENKYLGRHNIKDIWGELEYDEYDPAGAFSGDPTYNNQNNVIQIMWNVTDYSKKVNADEPEFYILFTVKDGASDILNVGTTDLGGQNGLFHLVGAVVYDESCENRYPNIQGTQDTTKGNACEGAFKLTVDPEKLDPGVYINKLEATINGQKTTIDAAVENEDGTISFPVRLTNSKGGSVNVSISGTYGSSADDTTSANAFTMGEFALELNSPTAYAEQSVTVSKN